jgi:hypothetical protein
MRDAARTAHTRPRRIAMTNPNNPNDVRPALRKAEAELARHLEEACEDYENIGEESTDELVRLEEELLAAARAVDQTVRLRRKLDDAKTVTDDAKETATEAAPPESRARTEPSVASSPAASGDPGGTRVREFRTASGSEWRVWEVRPGAGGRPARPELYPPDYARGWLAFELLSGQGRKRLPGFASEWTKAPDTDLELMLNQAVDVPNRKRTPPGPSGSGP